MECAFVCQFCSALLSFQLRQIRMCAHVPYRWCSERVLDRLLAFSIRLRAEWWLSLCGGWLVVENLTMVRHGKFALSVGYLDNKSLNTEAWFCRHTSSQLHFVSLTHPSNTGQLEPVKSPKPNQPLRFCRKACLNATSLCVNNLCGMKGMSLASAHAEFCD